MSDNSSLQETFLSREPLVKGVLLEAFRDRVRLPDGGESVREWIRHPGASAVVPLFPDGTTVLIRQFRYPPQKVFIEVPAGKLDGADPETTARRELAEETGWLAHDLVHIGMFYPCIGYSDERIHVFLARDLHHTTAHTDTDEFVEPFRLPFTEALAMAERGDIRDMKTLTALFLARAYLEKG